MTKDLPDFQAKVETTLTEVTSLQHGLDAAKSASPSTGDAYIATDTNKFYVCYTDGAWTRAALGFTELWVTGKTVSSISTWEDWDISGSVPAGTKMVYIWLYNSGGTPYNAGIRKNGSSATRYHTVIANGGSSMDICEVDDNRIIEIYSNNQPSVAFTIAGYWS